MALPTPALLFFGAACMLGAVATDSITLVGADYRSTLQGAVVLMVVADLCCLAAYRRGGPARWAAVVIALPSVFIVMDVLRRAPYVWKFN